MSDVAALAGVSGQTVSRVVNGAGNVTDATRERVEAAMTRLGYRPHAAARALRTGRTLSLGVVVTTLSTVGNSLMLESLTATAADSGYSLVLALVDPTDPASFAAAIETLTDREVDGAVVVNEASRFAVALAEPPALRLVLVDADDDRFDTVSSDHEAGAHAVTAHLIAASGAPVHHVAGPDGSFAAESRTAGWRRAHAEAELEPPALLRGDWTAESGAALGGLLAGSSDVRAVFCANDQTALGVMSALHEAGRAIPEEVMVAGFDGTADAARFWPALTTVAQDFRGLARVATAILAAEEPAGPARHVVLPVHLLARASTRR